MSLKLRRALNAFILGTVASFGMLALEDWQNLTDAVRVGDWASLKVLGLSLIGGAIAGGIRALQSNSPLPSPEPAENSPSN